MPAQVATSSGFGACVGIAQRRLGLYLAAFFSNVMGRALRGGRRAMSRTARMSSLSSLMVRLRVLRCMPSSRAARHWFPLFSC